jgi:hypothetical protein
MSVKKRKKKILKPTRAQLEIEIARLTVKCRDRSNEYFLLSTKFSALTTQMDALKRSWRTIIDIIGPGPKEF